MKKTIGDKVDKRKARRLKRRMAKKVKFMNLDEGNLLFSNPSAETREYFKRIHQLSNQHLLVENYEIKHSGTITQLLDMKQSN